MQTGSPDPSALPKGGEASALKENRWWTMTQTVTASGAHLQLKPAWRPLTSRQVQVLESVAETLDIL